MLMWGPQITLWVFHILVLTVILVGKKDRTVILEQKLLFVANRNYFMGFWIFLVGGLVQNGCLPFLVWEKYYSCLESILDNFEFIKHEF